MSLGKLGKMKIMKWIRNNGLQYHKKREIMEKRFISKKDGFLFELHQNYSILCKSMNANEQNYDWRR
jgi:hypothetical protein